MFIVLMIIGFIIAYSAMCRLMYYIHSNYFSFNTGDANILSAILWPISMPVALGWLMSEIVAKKAYNAFENWNERRKSKNHESKLPYR
jgi:hypothetical protein